MSDIMALYGPGSRIDGHPRRPGDTSPNDDRTDRLERSVERAHRLYMSTMTRLIDAWNAQAEALTLGADGAGGPLVQIVDPSIFGSSPAGLADERRSPCCETECDVSLVMGFCPDRSLPVRDLQSVLDRGSSRIARARMERALDKMLSAAECIIAVLDLADGDAEAEPILGATEESASDWRGQMLWGLSGTSDREGPDDDLEPTLGAVEDAEYQVGWGGGRLAVEEDEPSLGSLGDIDQRPWGHHEHPLLAFGGGSDLECDADEDGVALRDRQPPNRHADLLKQVA